MIVFRTDGNSQIGLGHVMRCMSIADAFVEAGEECLFVLADVSVEAVVKKRGFETFVMNTRFDCMETEFDKMQSVNMRFRPRYIVVDSYFVTEEYFRFLGTLGRVVYLDDLAAFAYPVDVLVNYNVYAADMDYAAIYKRGDVCLPRCILGVEYAPLRKEFRDIPACMPRENVQDIFVSTGGADTVHLALRLVRFLTGQPECAKELKFHILLGEMNVDRDEIMELASGIDNIMVHRMVQEMKSWMRMCDIAVSAAGSTLYELCACGVPTITYVVA
ncbi:MAG: UDP-2,4-diacetamido-2,4,6-trideoxy-beta-L-altropyranose hydrolase, partial [Odoribacter sp.]|nr:UDP-2,4-diacetamido-2,4,6-trideoxy-beta-L-altropyranose hydrolase [Odoribacter sp.]